MPRGAWVDQQKAFNKKREEEQKEKKSERKIIASWEIIKGAWVKTK